MKDGGSDTSHRPPEWDISVGSRAQRFWIHSFPVWWQRTHRFWKLDIGQWFDKLFCKMQKQPFSLLTRGFKEEFFTFFSTFIIAHFLYPHWKKYFSFYWGKRKAANFFNNSGLAWRTAGSWLWSWYVLRKHEYSMRIIILY